MFKGSHSLSTWKGTELEEIWAVHVTFGLRICFLGGDPVQASKAMSPCVSLKHEPQRSKRFQD